MAGRRKAPAPFPSDQDILRFIHESEGHVGKREIGRAFHLDAGQKMLLKKRLRELELTGSLQKGRGKRYADPGTLPSVAVVEVSGLDTDGDVLAKPVRWEHDTPTPVIFMKPEKRGHPALGIGDRALARLVSLGHKNKHGAPLFEGSTIRRLTTSPAKIMGVLKEAHGRFRLQPTDRRARNELIIEYIDAGEALAGDLVRAELLESKRLGLKQARVVERLAATDNHRAASLIAIHDHGIPTAFSPEAEKIADNAVAAPMAGREDLRNIPLITIDSSDARDFDDAVYAEPDNNSANKGGWHLIVAIADVSWYVRPSSALDKAAYQRGNSVYFPDRVVPMLPETLSNEWCSLVAKEDRPCMAAHLWLDARGKLIKHQFSRAMMRSHARLTYDQVQKAHDGETDDMTDILRNDVIKPLYEAYRALASARNKRGALELELPERQVIIGDDGNVKAISLRKRFDSHKLIEEFMITANVAAAQTLENFRQPCMYRVHNQPSLEKMESLRQFLKSMDISLPKGQVIRAGQFNAILERVANTPQMELVNTVILRSQSQAEYSPENIGHFGLNLHKYAHFTSPIRRYSDLLVHRALITGLKLGKALSEGKLEAEAFDFIEAGIHLSQCERRAAAAERSAVERFTASFMVEHVGNKFTGRINGVTRFGLFVQLHDTGAEGLIPISSLPDDYYIHDEIHHCLRGEHNGRVFTLGQNLDVTLVEATPITGGMILCLDGNKDTLKSGKPGKSGPHIKRRKKHRRKVEKRCTKKHQRS